jgi:hypothetical protein
MEKDFVPFELSVKLKEFGFNEPCWGYYHVNEGYSIGYAFCYSDAESQPEIGYLAPLFQQAFRWLLALANKDEHFSNKWTISYNEDYYSLFLGGCNMGVFEEELECLKKLIEIVELKK